MKYYTYDGQHFPPNVELITHLITSDDEFLHAHEYFEVFYILSGKITHITKETKQVLETGHIVVLRGFGIDTHTFKRSGECVHRDIMIAPSLFKSACNYIEMDMYDKIMKSPNPAIAKIDLLHINYLESLLNTINNIPLSDWQNKKPLIRSTVVSLLSLLYQPAKSQPPLPFWFNQFLDRFTKTEFIQGGVPAIISTVNYNKIYLCRIFKQYMNITMTEYLNQIRLNYAETYLRNTNMSITDICGELGFSSISYFEKLFRKKYNMPPLKYRNMTNKYN